MDAYHGFCGSDSCLPQRFFGASLGLSAGFGGGAALVCLAGCFLAAVGSAAAPLALCSSVFETIPGGQRRTLRVGTVARRLAGRDAGGPSDPLQPRLTAFVAAGCLAAHSSILLAVPFDPDLRMPESHLNVT